MNWQRVGPNLTAESLRRFEDAYGKRVPADIVWFLTHECNGGEPPEDFYIHADEPNQEFKCFTGVFGIDYPRKDLLGLLRFWPQDREHLWPVGGDHEGGTFVLHLTGRYKGQVRYLRSFDDPDDTIPNRTFFVAKDIRAFADILSRPSLPIPTD